MRREALAALLALGVLGVCRPAQAQPDLREQARRLFDQGVVLFESGDHEGALAAFEDAQRLHPHPRILRNIAGAQEMLQRYVDAIATLERFVADPAVTARERGQAEAQIRRLRSLLGRLEIAASPPGAEVLVDGRLVGIAPLPEPVSVAAREVHVVVRAARHRTEERDVRVTAGSFGRVELTLEPLNARLHLDANAPGARAAVGDERPHTLPRDLQLPPGTYEVRTTAPGFSPDTSRIVLAPDEDRTLTVVLDRPPSTLRLDVQPPDARVVIDGEVRSAGGTRTLRLPGGSHRLRVEGLDRVPWEGEVDMRPGASHSMRARLGRDRVWVSPAWFWGGVVTTIGVATVATITGVRVLILDQESKGTNPPDQQRALRDEMASMKTATDTLWVGTLIAGVGTFVFFLLSRGEPPDADVTFR